MLIKLHKLNSKRLNFPHDPAWRLYGTTHKLSFHLPQPLYRIHKRFSAGSNKAVSFGSEGYGNSDTEHFLVDERVKYNFHYLFALLDLAC